MALVAVMLLLMAMSALAAALAISSTTETMIARNHQNAAQARAAAEAGLAHAIDITLDYLAVWQADFASVEMAMDALLTNPAMYIDDYDVVEAGVILAGIGTSYSSLTNSVSSFSSIFYEAVLIDDDDEDARDIVLSADDLTRMGEDGDPGDDNNKKLIIRAVGYAGGNAVSAVEATISSTSMPGLLTDGDLTLGGSFSLGGSGGSVHTNGDFTDKGAAWSAAEGCTASGSGVTGPPACTGGQGEIAIPDKSADDYLSLAKYILHDDGEMTTVSTGTKAACDPCAGGWEFSSGTWTLSGTLAAPDGSVFYVDGDVELEEGQAVTFFATGDVGAGNGNWEPALPGIMWVNDGDFDDSGNPNFGTATNAGLIVIGEQISLAGTLTIYGAIIVRDATNDSSTVTDNLLTGNVTMTYDGSLDGNFFGVSAWRRSF